MAKKVEKDCCGKCRFRHLVRDQNDADITQLFCRRFPPTVAFVPVRDDEGTRQVPKSVNPPVKPDGWCGEFQLEVAPA